MSKATRLIDADALSKMLDKHGGIYGGKEAEMSEYFNSLLKYAPTVDAEPVKHGHWEFVEPYDDCSNIYKCTVCGFHDTHSPTVEVPYCWHCGARMDEKVKK